MTFKLALFHSENTSNTELFGSTKHPDNNYREATLNPTNPVNRAISQSHISQHSSSQSASRNNQKLLLSEQKLEKLTKALIIYFGPVAKRMIKSALKKVSTYEELCVILANKIPDSKQRQQFLDNQ